MDDSTQTCSSETDYEPRECVGTRKRRRHVKGSNYLQRKCRKVYKLNKALDQSLQESDVGMSGVYSSCVSTLTCIADGFKHLTL